MQSNIIQIHAVKESNLQLIIKLHQQAQRLYAEMGHIVLAVAVEGPALITVELQYGYKIKKGWSILLPFNLLADKIETILLHSV